MGSSEAGIRQFVNGGGAWLRRSADRLRAGRARRAAQRAARLNRRGARAAVPRSWWEVELSAGLAVRSDLRLEDFLRFRLARYAGRLPVPLEALPFDVSVENG
jgi:hypothetical protein